MALLAGHGLFLIKHVLPRVKNRDSMLGIGRMSMSWNIDDLLTHLERAGVAYNEEAGTRIGLRNSRYSSRDFFELLGFDDCQDIDFNENEGCTVLHDMNYPISPDLRNAFDFVFENGTIEHIFDVKTVIGNIASAVKVGGTVCHLSPMAAFNHGFYNFSLNFFYDFYESNGFSNMESFMLRSARDWRKNQNTLWEPWPYTHEQVYVNPDVFTSEYSQMGIGFIAEKERHLDEVVVPVQAAYDRAKDLQSELRNW